MRNVKILIISGQDVEKRLPIIKICRGFEFVVMGSSRNIKWMFDELGVRYIYFRMVRKVAPISHILSVSQMVQAIKAEKPDIIQTYDTIPTFLARIAWFFDRNALVVSTVNGLGELYTYDKKKYLLYRKVYELANRILLLGTRMLIFQNHDDLSFFRQRGMAGRKYRVIPGSGIDTKYYERSWYSGQDREKMRKSLLGSEKPFVITMIGRVVKSKGVIPFARMAEKIAASRDDVEAVLVGPDDKDSADRLNDYEMGYFRDKVKWLGERKDIRDILYVSDICILLSAREGMPRVVMEAAAMEVPSVVLDVPGCREIVIDGRTGFVVEDEHQALGRVLELLGNKEMLYAFGTEARRRMEQVFSLDAIAQDMAALWQNIIRKE